MTEHRFKNLAQLTQSAATELENLSPTLANIVEVTRANAGLVEVLDRVSLNIEQLDRRFTRRFNGINQRFDAIDQRFDAIDQRFEAIDQRFEAIDQRFEAIDQRFEAIDQRFDAIDQRLENAEKVNLARSMNSSCTRGSASIEWIKKDNQRLPLQINTLLEFHNLNNDQITQFLQYYNLETNELDNIRNKSRLMNFLGISNQYRL